MKRMDCKLRGTTKCIFASVIAVTAFAIAIPASATGPADKPTGTTMPAPTLAKSTTVAITARASHSERVESRISEMHAKLQITQEEEGQWNGVAQVMRENAKTLDTLTQARIDNANSMTAMADLKSYSEIADANAEGTRKFVAAFQPLYDSMSDSQKKGADALFQGHHGGKSQTASKRHS